MSLSRKACFSGLAAAVWFAGSAMATPPLSDLQNNTDAVIRRELSLSEYSLTYIPAPEIVDGAILAGFDFGGEPYSLYAEPSSVRSSRFQVLVQGADGTLEPYIAPAPATYRGTVLELDGSVAAVSLIDGRLTARILSGDEAWVIQPLTDVIADAPRDVYVVYSAEHVISEGHRCGMDDLFDPTDSGVLHRVDPHAGHDHEHEAEGGEDKGKEPVLLGEDLLEPSLIMEAEVAYDADFEFYQKNGSNVNTTIADIENVQNGVNVIYERDCEITHRITTIIVRSNSNDPYTSTDAATLLGQFQNEWNSNQSSVQRDLAHLMTGKNMNGGTIGIAYLAVVCNRGSAYGVSESRYTTNYNSRVGLTSHEKGHNWAAPHCCGGCSGCSTCRIMCPCLGGCSGIVTSFGASEISSIVNFRNTRNCLEEASDFDLEVGPLQGGQPGQFDVSGGAPNATVRLYYSLVGEGDCFIADLNVTLGIANCVQAATGTTDGSGNKAWTLNIPNVRRNTVVWFQSAQSGATSNVVLTQVNR